MSASRSTSPLAIFFLVLPYGISAGFAAVTLPFVLTKVGLPVAVSASIVAVGISSNIWLFLWGPVADLTLTPRRWYLIGDVAALTVVAALTAVVFLSQVATSLVALPLGRIMAYTVADPEKGRAAGWYQAGNLGGTGVGGGAGVWLTSHYSIAMAGAVLAATMLMCALGLFFVPDVRVAREGTVGQKLRQIGAELRDLLRSPIALLASVLVCSPVGAGAASNLWSAVAPQWHASPDRVALVTGALSGVASVIGCVLGGWVADRVGRWWSYFGAGVLMAVVATWMALAPHTMAIYSAGVLFYAAVTGTAYAAYSAVLLYVIGRGAASTKYATLSSLGNLPVAYMTAFDGRAHDRLGAAGMLYAESVVGAGFTVLFLVALGRIKARARTPQA